jgi:hypothetical protein
MDAFENPFFLLKATPRDHKSRLLELAEEMALHGDHDAAAGARNTLINPRNRLAAEVGWFPGVAPARIDAALQAIRDTGRSGGVGNLPALCAANLELTVLTARGGQADAGRLKDAILRVAALIDGLDANAVLLAINEDRQAAGFPQVGDLAQIEHEIAERVRHYQRSLTKMLDALPSAAMVDTYEKLIAESAAAGAAPRLVVDLLAAYELHAGDFLAGEAERILALIDETRTAADAKAPAPQVGAAVQKIVAAIADWDRIAQPIQLARQNAGLDHEDSKRVAFRARGLAVHLFNAHDYLDHAKRLSTVLKHHFAEVAAVNDVVEEDVRALREIETKRQAQAAEEAQAKAKFAAEVAWETTFGLIFKDRFRISVDGIEYKGRMTPAAQINGIAWGAIRNIVNGVHTGTHYYFRYGSPAGIVDITLDNEKQNGELIPRVWRAFCVPMLFRMMETWRGGGAIRIGEHEIRDGGIVLKKSKLFKADEWRFFEWNAMKKSTHGGLLSFTGNPDADFKAAFSFKDMLNVHILDFAVDRVWQGKADRLSNIFNDG